MSPEGSVSEKIKKRAERFRNKLNILLLASVKNPVLLNFEIQTSQTKKDVHEYDRMTGILEWNFSKGDRLFVDVDGSGTVTMNGRSVSGLDYRHRDLMIPFDVARVEIEISESGELGSHKRLRLPLRCVVYQRDEELYSLFNQFQVAIDLVKMDEKWDFVEEVEDIFRNIPQLGVHPLSYLIHSDIFSNVLGEGLTNFDPFLHFCELQDLELPREQLDLSSVKDSLSKFFAKLNDSRESGKQPEIIPLANAHIDLAWLWPIAETREKIKRTFSTAVNLLKRRDLTFLQSMVTHYEIFKEMEPELFDDIKKLVSLGKWDPVGGMIVESDCNLTGGESLVRQILYGQQFFKKEFGNYSNIAWLPDTFGYTQQLPQILIKSGFELFVTTKFTYNDTTRFPHDIFRWKAPDGSVILAHAHMRDYISDTDLSCVKDTIEKNPETSEIVQAVPLIYGYGDGGGGPTEEMVDRIKFINAARTTFYTGSDPLNYWLSKVKEKESRLPSIQGELYLEAHRGTYTTHADIKKVNRKIESELYAAEAIEAFDHAKTGTKFVKEWRKLLESQFHDILPGSSIDEAYRVSLNELNDLSEHIRRECIGMDTMPGVRQRSFTVFSPYWWGTTAWITLSAHLRGSYIEDEEHRVLPVLNNGRDYGFYAELERGMGFYTFTVLGEDEGTSYSKVKSSPARHEWKVDVESNRLSSITIDGQGLPIPQLMLFNDFPYYFDAWDLDDLETKNGHLVEPDEIKKSALEGYGDIVEATYNLNPGRIVMKLSFPVHESFVRTDFDVDWKGYNRLLRMYLKTGEGRCLGESAYSTIERRSEGPKYEFPNHRFVAVERDNSTLLLLNDSKYGYSFGNGFLGVSLLRSPFWPDPFSDRGRNSFSFSYGNLSGRDQKIYYEEGVKFNTTPFVVNERKKHKGNLKCEGAVIGSFKVSEDGEARILRLCNPTGEREQFSIGLPFEVPVVEETDLLEERKLTGRTDNHYKSGQEIDGILGPYEIKTLRLNMQK